MSQFATIKTQIKDKELLIQCLKEMGYSVEVGRNLRLYGYLDDMRTQTADIVIRRDQIGLASNDIGFRENNGVYEIIISNFDKKTAKGKEILNIEKKIFEIQNEILRRYADEKVRKSIDALKSKGFALRKRNEIGKKVVYEFVKIT